MLTNLGNNDLLLRPKIGFVAPSYIDMLSVFPTLDWAAQIANQSVSVLCGFSSHLEKSILPFLLRGQCGVVYMLARRPLATLPEPFDELYAQQRLLLVPTSSAVRQSRQSARERNRQIAEQCDQLVLPCLPPEQSSLYPIYQAYQSKCLLLDANP